MLAIRVEDGASSPVVTDVERPTPGYDEVRVDIQAASICGSDVGILNGDIYPAETPVTLGHEGAGEVAAVGAGVDHVAPGDRVVLNYILSCGNCRQCLQGNDNRCRRRESLGHSVDGVFAESIVVPDRAVVPMGENVPMEWGAIAGCAVSTAFHAVERSGLDAGDTALVMGVGGVGLHAVLWADFFGAGTVIAADVDPANLDGARAYGADVTVDPSEEEVRAVVDRETDGWGVDVAIECSGSTAALEDAVEAVRANTRFESGNVVSVGVQSDPMSVDYYGIREGMLTVSGDHTRYDLHRILRLLDRGAVDLDESITHRISPHDIDRGVELLTEADERVGRVVIDMTQA